MINIKHSAGCLLLLLAACTPKSRTADWPLIEMANNSVLDISRVELTDSVTVLHMDAYFRPGNWIRIAKGSCLKIDTTRYMLTGAEGIEPDSLLWMPESGEASFTLFFEPIPVDTKQVDFTEGDVKGGYSLYGIDLTGKKDYGRPEGVPAQALNPTLPDSVPMPMLESGQTTVRVHLLNYRPEYAVEKVHLYVNTLLGKQEAQEATVDQETGLAEVTFMLDGTALAYLMITDGYAGGDAWLAPGETADLYVCPGYHNIWRGADKEDAPKRMPFQRLYATGTYAGLNVLNNRTGDGHKTYSMDLYTGEFADYRMTSAQYAAHVMNRYKALADSVAQSGLSLLEKEQNLQSLQQEACHAMAQGNGMREHNYRSTHNQWDRSIAVEGIDPIKPEETQQIKKLFDITNPKLLMGSRTLDYIMALCQPEVDWMDREHLPDGVIKELCQTLLYLRDAENGRMADETLARLKTQQNTPFFCQLLQRKQAAALEEKNKLATLIMATPDVARERLFDAIIAPHKGKVVLVDFWNTWCGPCRAAIKHNEPLKQSELKSDNLVWIYIANETSPLKDYTGAIPGIQGLHYRLNAEQWEYLTGTEFNLDGIPSYVVVDKAGHASLRNDLRDHDLLKKTLKDMLAQ